MRCLFIVALSFVFGLYIGMYFAENDDVHDPFEIFLYWF